MVYVAVFAGWKCEVLVMVFTNSIVYGVCNGFSMMGMTGICNSICWMEV